MDLTLVFSALLMGLAGSAHCVAMCGPTSAAITGSCVNGARRPGLADIVFHTARAFGYMAAGAIAASGVALLERLGAAAPALRPLWVLLHLAAFGLGLWLIWQGRQPEWMERLGGPRTGAPSTAGGGDGWQPVRAPGRAGASRRAAVAGALWVAWPCGLLQSALVVAALAQHAWSGALVMGAFALASAPALAIGPWLLWRGLQGPAGGGRGLAWAVRLSGVGLVLASAWAIGHDFWLRVAAYCMT